MTQGEYAFYLREVHGHWSASNVSPSKLAELADANLIELRPGVQPSVRLTSEGGKYKAAGRSRYQTRLPTTRTPKKSPRSVQRRAPTFRPKPLV